ncbi:MAG: FkbM family methyltransferase [Thermoleophilia bacterium]
MRATAIAAVRAAGLETPARRARSLMRPAVRRAERDHELMLTFIRTALPADATCIDVGAHTGDVLREIVAACPEGDHWAFEANPLLVGRLRARYPQVRVEGCALSDEEGITSFFIPDGEPSRAGMIARRRGAREIEVMTAPLDRFHGEIGSADFLKIDVEGAERLVLEGGSGLLEQSRPAVIFEFGRSQRAYGTRPADVWDRLVDRAGLRMMTLEGDPLTLPEFHRLWESGARWNFLARA